MRREQQHLLVPIWKQRLGLGRHLLTDSVSYHTGKHWTMTAGLDSRRRLCTAYDTCQTRFSRTQNITTVESRQITSNHVQLDHVPWVSVFVVFFAQLIFTMHGWKNVLMLRCRPSRDPQFLAPNFPVPAAKWSEFHGSADRTCRMTKQRLTWRNNRFSMHSEAPKTYGTYHTTMRSCPVTVHTPLLESSTVHGMGHVGGTTALWSRGKSCKRALSRAF